MEITVTEFKAKCLALIELVHRTGEPLVITKRGKLIAELRAKNEVDSDKWSRLEGSVVEYDDPFSPTVVDSDIEPLI